MLYEKFDKHWKALMWIPIVFLVLSIAVITFNIATTGPFRKRDVELVGGKSLTFEVSNYDLESLKSALPYATVRVTSGVVRNLIVDIPLDWNETETTPVVEKHATITGTPTLRT